MRYAGLGVQLAVILVVCVLAGQWVDRKLGTDGIITNFTGGDAGIAAGMGTPADRAANFLDEFDQVFPGTKAAHDNKVVLHGNVHDWSEVREAQRAAWSTPGVAEVENRLVVVP